MPPRTPRPAYPRHIVTAVLVAHDGARWLPASLAGLGAQTRAPQRVVAVDTGSSDDSERLLAAALGESAVLSRPAGTGFGAAVQAGLDAFAGAPSVPASSADPLEWVWLLHDDCVPEPTALEALLGYVDEAPSAGVVGPKCRTWDGRYLLELGITTDITGRRETGLARRELDQGQHDRVLDVLAVGSAGALIRRDVWDALGGYDPALPLFRDDLDFGWRANLAGWRVAVVPAAVLRHVRALERGVRTGPAARRTRRQDREHAIYVLLANAPPARLPLLLVRLALAAVLRPLGLLLARRPRRAVDEVAAYARVAVRPVALLRARRRRAGARRVPYRDLRPLFPRFGARVRHYGEALTDLVTAERFGAAAMLPAVPVPEPGRSVRTAGTPPGAGRRGRRRVIETGPVADEAVDLEFGGPGLLRWLLVRPGVLLALGLVLLALVADRGVLSGALHGGVLLPAPGGAADWWSSYLSSWHPVGTGSATGAPPYLAVLAGLATVLLGKAWLAVDVLVLGAVPLAGLSAYSAAGALTRRLPLRVWAALSYAVLPVLTGAVATGRLDGIVAAVALPWLLRCGARAVLGPGRGWRRAFSAGLWLALAGAFAPVLELLAALVVLGAVLARWSVPGRRRRLAAGGIVLA
ncbi:MAG TPA: glycosyltransferase family 2 protein, partial [Mycobacteriales bacterium]|nr:glycosyltransferase family 2 protein [Mycobacteriales bacterium]